MGTTNISTTPGTSTDNTAKMKILSLTVVLSVVCLALAFPLPLAQQQGTQGQQGNQRHFFGGIYNPYNYGGYYGGVYNPYGYGGYGGYGYGGYGYNNLWG